MPVARLQVVTVPSMPFAENTYLVWRQGLRESVVVDPGLEPDRILSAVRQRGLAVVAILNTHGHADHIAGNAAMKEAFPTAPLIIGVGDAPMLEDPELNLSRPFGFDIVSPRADREVNDGEVLTYCGIPMRVHDLPGHSPGHVVFVLEEESPILIIGGDTLFEGSIGRTDFPGGDFEQLARGIRGKLYTLPDDTIVLPGHGETTTVGVERQNNPFVSGN